MVIRYVLVTEGSDDRILQRPIEWLLNRHFKNGFEGDWANPDVFDDPSRELNIRMDQVKRFYPADLAFVHRDSDTGPREVRIEEINQGVNAATYPSRFVCVVPV